MDLASIVGIVVAFVGILVGMVLKGLNLSALWNPAAILIIIFGTIGSVSIATPVEQLRNLPKLFSIIFSKSKSMTQEEAIDIIVDLADNMRKEGLLVLETKVPSINDSFLVDGLMMLLEGSDNQYIQKTLEANIEAMEERHGANAQIFTQAGTYAPTLGVLGAVVGLIAALSNLADTTLLGHAISGAFVATLLGIFTGYVIWHPFANKLIQKSAMEVEVKRLMIDGVLAMHEGQNPRVLKERLLAKMATGERLVSSQDKKA